MFNTLINNFLFFSKIKFKNYSNLAFFFFLFYYFSDSFFFYFFYFSYKFVFLFFFKNKQFKSIIMWLFIIIYKQYLRFR